MAVVIEGFTVVVRLDRIQERFSHPTFEVPNSTALFDDHLWRCAFMAEADARAFVHYLGALGMKVEPGPDCEAVIVDEFDVAKWQPCEWLLVRSVIDEVSSGTRAQPRALGDLTKPTKPKKPVWNFW